MPTIIIFILVLLLVVVVHEAGHFFAAKQMGMRVKEFAFGFPPRLFSYKKGETRYSFNAIPLGGYVSIDGENGNEEDSGDSKLFTNKSKLAQAWVLFAGPLMNFILAFVLFSISFMVGYGDQEKSTLVISYVVQNSPAEISGIKSGDRIQSVYTQKDNTKYINPNAELFQSITSKGEAITIEVLRKNKNKETINVTPELTNSGYVVGVALGNIEAKKFGFFESIKQGFISTKNMIFLTLSGFGQIIKNIFIGEGINATLTGPIGLVKETATAVSFGFGFLLSFIAIISINLGVLNLFPFPALDGGRLLFLLIEKIKGSKINIKTANIVNLIGFSLLIILMIFVTIKDITRLF